MIFIWVFLYIMIGGILVGFVSASAEDMRGVEPLVVLFWPFALAVMLGALIGGSCHEDHD